jgi:hypothetical protein
MTPGRFRKRPVVVEAMRWDGTAEGATPIIDWVLANGPADGPVARYSDCQLAKVDGDPPSVERTEPSIAIETLEGTMRASAGDWVVRSAGDWVVRGVHGEFYPVKPDIFDVTYEEATDG